MTPGNELPKVGYDQIPSLSTKPSIDYDFNSVPNDFKQGFDKRIKYVFQKSGMFSQVKESIGTADFHFNLTLDVNEDCVGGKAGAAVCGLTTCIIPLSITETYVLTAKIKKDGQILKSYHYRDHYKTAVWTLIGMLGMPFTYFPAQTELRDNMLRNLLRDIQKDGILQTSAIINSNYHKEIILGQTDINKP
jgi:hypothetical protein